MVDALMRLKFGKLFRGSTAHITPVNIPIAILILQHFVAKLLECLTNDDISTLRCAQVQMSLHLLLLLVIRGAAIID